MAQLTVGEVSGIIAVGIFLVQVAVGLIIPMILVGLLTNENTVNTWSVLGRLLHSSRWPTFLRASSATSDQVNRRVIASEWLQTGILAIVTIASIVTPLGLYDAIEPSNKPTVEPFNYLHDNSPFGYGTPPRSQAPFSRVCGTDYACPGQQLNKSCHTQGLTEVCTNVSYSPLVPSDIRNLFNQGGQQISPTVAGLFDIQWRSYSNWSSGGFSTLPWFQRQEYRELSNLVLNNKIEVVEGLVVDMITGGIGFRNHTAPGTSTYGRTWMEDILFIEPETQCVDLNISVDFRIISSGTTAQSGYQDIYITDRGGLSNLSRLPPEFPDIPNGQGDLHLTQRANAAAWYNNFLTLAFYNATGPDPVNITRNDIKPGQQLRPPFPKSCNFSADVPQCPGGTFAVDWSAVQSSINFGGYLNLYDWGGKPLSEPNPWNVGTHNFTGITQLCGGSTIASEPNINNTIIGCSMLYGAPRRQDSDLSLIPDPLSLWTMPIYTCATALKATIRTVTFTYNGTGISSLNVTSTKPKTYTTLGDVPVWGVETVSLPGVDYTTMQPLWGILGTANSYEKSASTYAKVDNFSTITQSSLYLPGFMDNEAYLLTQGGTDTLLNFPQNMPGLNFYAKALQIATSISAPYAATSKSNATYYQGGADYSGFSSLALFAKWQNLTSSANTAGRILDLVWTDYSANAVVGTRGWGLSTSQQGTAEILQVNPTTAPVIVYQRIIRYRLPFATPAFATLAALLAILVVLLILVTKRKSNAAQMRAMLEATSVGRVAAMGLWPVEERDATSENRKEVEGVDIGGKKIQIMEKEVVKLANENNKQQPRQPKHAETHGK